MTVPPELRTIASTNFKAYLRKEDDVSAHPEVRRFGIDKELDSNFKFLKEKVQTIFPSIRGKNFTVSWKDDDEDIILISSDEELKIALKETSHEICRLYLTLHSDNEKEETKASTAEHRVRHPNIICDGCDKGIYGFRYKCIQCPDFDMCMECEAQSLHPDHCMLRIPVPMQWKTHYTRRLARHMNRVNKISGASENSKEGHHKSTRCEPRCRYYSETPSWIDIVSAYVKDWTEAAHVAFPMTETQKPEQSQVPSQKEPKTAEAPKKSDSNPHSRKNSDSNVEFLKNIGEHIAQFLDPLGIDVNVQVKNDKVQNTTQMKNDKAQNTTQMKNDKAQNTTQMKNDKAQNTTSAFTRGDIPVLVQEKNDKDRITTPFSHIPGFDSSFAAADYALKSTYTPIVTRASVNTNIQEQKFPERESVSKAEDHVSCNTTVDMDSSNEDLIVDKSNPETEGWTLLNENDSPTSSTHSTPIPSRAASVAAEVLLPISARPFAPSENASGTQTEKPLYPPLPQDQRFYECPRAKEIVKPQHHFNSKINSAVEVMMDMGFSNEGGWLTQLLSAKDGDISKALDILAPIRR